MRNELLPLYFFEVVSLKLGYGGLIFKVANYQDAVNIKNIMKIGLGVKAENRLKGRRVKRQRGQQPRSPLPSPNNLLCVGT